MTTVAPRSRTAPAPTGSEHVSTDTLRRLAERVSIARADHEWLEVENPATGALLGAVPKCEAADIAAVIDRARTAAVAWRRTPLEQRAEIVLRFHDLVLDSQAALLDVVQLESGKARRHAFEEIMDVAIAAR